MHSIRRVIAARNADADCRCGERGHYRSRPSDAIRRTGGAHCIHLRLHRPGAVAGGSSCGAIASSARVALLQSGVNASPTPSNRRSRTRVSPDRRITLRDLYVARARIAPWIRRTPLVVSPSLSAYGGARISLKLETAQDTGAFKLRGATNFRSRLGGQGAVAGGSHRLDRESWARRGARGAVRGIPGGRVHVRARARQQA